MTEIEQIIEIHYKLKEFYDVKDFIGASKYIALQYALYNQDVDKLMCILMISKTFRNNEFLSEPLKLVEHQIEKLIGRKIL